MSTEKIMEQAQVFASAWSVVGGPCGRLGDAMEVATQEKAELKRMVADLAAELDTLAAKLAELKGQEPVAWVEVVSTHEGPYNFEGMALLGKGNHLLYARPVPAEPVNARLLEAIKRLSFCAQTTGGTAGRDEGLCAAIGEAEKAIAAAEAQQERLLQDMHDAGREIDRVMAESAPKEPVAEPVNARLLTALKACRNKLAHDAAMVAMAVLDTCESGDSVLTRKKYLCSREEMEAQKEKIK